MAEELSSLLNQGLTVNTNENHSNTHVHPRLDEYKSRSIKSGDQSNRRNECLNRQKNRRFDAQNYARKLAEGDINDEDMVEIDSHDISESKDVDGKGKKKKHHPYKNQLMLSEWVIDPPLGLEKDWLMVVCPVGKRLLLVANKGHTTAYTKSGHALNKFPSLLPGGSFKTWKKSSSSSFTILDCIYDEINRTYWMLDLISYKGTSMYESETDFRFFWLNTKLLEENPNISTYSPVNPYKFIPCSYVPCLNNDIVNALTDMTSYQVDGVLFYHRLAHYHPGRTPLVGWLKPYMIPDILNIPMPLSIMESAPVEFNREILKDANEKLQNTLSDKSFNNPKSPQKNNNKMETVENNPDSKLTSTVEGDLLSTMESDSVNTVTIKVSEDMDT